MTDKIYVGNAKTINSKYGDFQKIQFHKDDINKMVEFMKNEGTDFITIDSRERKSPSAKGWTHYMEVSQWKPDNQKAGTLKNPKKDGDLPF